MPNAANFVVRSPAKQGDLFRAALSRPKAIGLIDGYFEGVPSVWHKEILWALSQGIAVFGSASMGALRAAELDTFGMVGIGCIYEWYRNGILEDDDEVAVIHGPKETGFLPLSEPMVNIRSTCQAAVRNGLLKRQTAEATIAAAKRLHYRDRRWETVIAAAKTQDSATRELQEFSRWIDTGRVDQKRLDAEALIARVLSFTQESRQPKTANFRFEWTDLWDRVAQEWMNDDVFPESADHVSMSAVIDELRLEPERYRALRSRALVRSVLLGEADRQRVAADRDARRQYLARLREALGLMRKADLDAWAERNMVNAEDLELLMDEEAQIQAVSSPLARALDPHILSILRLDDSYAAAHERARVKQNVLKGDTAAEDLPPPLLLSWFFGQKLRQSIPADLDTYIEELGFTSREKFYRLLAAEYLYLHKGNDGEGS
jgi:hypothetical protein